MHQQPSDLSACTPKSNPAIGGRHFGPVMIYMCEVPNAASSNGDCSWVKVAEDSYTGTESSWGTVRCTWNICGMDANGSIGSVE
jgi:cellulase